jgi:phage terminase small subunit
VTVNGAVTENDKPPIEFGPCMRALKPQQQRAVLAVFHTEGNRTEAMALAGYSTKSHKSLKSHASAFFRNERVRAAVREVAEHEIAIAEPELLALTWKIARDVGTAPRDRLRAVGIIWDRTNPVLHKHEVRVGVHLTAEEIDVTHYRALQKLNAPQQAFLERFGVNGIERVRQLVYAQDEKQKRRDAIDGEFTEVPNE